jgi:hypothetical protein
MDSVISPIGGQAPNMCPVSSSASSRYGVPICSALRTDGGPRDDPARAGESYDGFASASWDDNVPWVVV